MIMYGLFNILTGVKQLWGVRDEGGLFTMRAEGE